MKTNEKGVITILKKKKESKHTGLQMNFLTVSEDVKVSPLLLVLDSFISFVSLSISFNNAFIVSMEISLESISILLLLLLSVSARLKSLSFKSLISLVNEVVFVTGSMDSILCHVCRMSDHSSVGTVKLIILVCGQVQI